MKYISDDGKVFETEKGCFEYEQKRKQEKANKEKLELERKDELNIINKKYAELQKLISDFEKKHGVKQKPYFAPVYELMNMLYLWMPHFKLATESLV